MKFKELSIRLLSFLLLASVLLSLMPTAGLLSTQVLAAEGNAWDVDGDGTLSILCIGNSFSVDAMQYVYQIASSLGISSIYLGNLYYGGCSLAQHWSYANADKAAYTYHYNDSGAWKSSSSYKMSTALTSRKWDFVTMQQASPDSGTASTYNSDLTNLISYVKGKLAAKSPDAKLLWHMTWAYEGGSTKLANSSYSNQSDMYSKIISAVQSKIVNDSNFSFVIPSGTAIQNTRTSLIKDNLCRDGYHLNENIGRYVAGLTVVKAITGLDISSVSFRPTNVPDGYNAIAIESANNAVATPYAITNSAYTDPATAPADQYYTTRTLNLKANSFWNSMATDGTHNTQYTSASDHMHYKKFFCTQRFNSYTLPVGSVIKLSSGWRYRPDGWLTDAPQASKPGNITASYKVCSDEWWENDDGKTYLYRAFNISKSDGSQYGSATTATINGIFKIYVPKEYTTSNLEPEALYTQIEDLDPPIPNNSRVKWSDAKDLQGSLDWTKEYIIVSDKSTTGNVYYAVDPTTPRMYNAMHAAKVTVNSNSGVERVYGASTDWAFKIQNRDTAYSTVAASESTYRSAFRLLATSSPQKLTDTYDGNYWAYHNSRWEMYNSDAFDEKAYGTGIRPDLFFNTNSDRMHFYLNSQYASGSKSYRSEFVNPGTDEPCFRMGSTKLANSGSYACFFLYLVDTAKANTEALYDKLKEVQKYLLVDHTYYEAEYAAFLEAVNSAYSIYGSSNGQASTQTTVDGALNTLIAKTKALNAYNEVEYMTIPYNKRIDADSKVGTKGALEGTYFLSRMYAGNVDNVYSFINIEDHVDTNTSTNSALDSYGIKRYLMNSNGVAAPNIADAITLHSFENTTNGYSIQWENSNFFYRSGNSWGLGPLNAAPQVFYFADALSTAYGDQLISIQSFNSSNTKYLLYCDAATSYFWTLKTVPEDPDNTYKLRTSFGLYQLSPTTLELYRALQFIQPYGDQDQAIKRYPQDLYKQFLSDFKSAMLAYTTYNTSGYFSNASAKTTCENWAKKLRAWADTLTQADTTLGYIDIPVEVFDFKSDGVMFEYDDTYGLVSNVSGATNTLPGTIWYYKSGAVSTTDNGGVTFRRGLTETKLVNGHMVYRQETVAYVAERILNDSGAATASINYLTQTNADYNETFRAKMATLNSADKLGTWNQTLAKTTTGQNGGDLDWNQVTTAYDMAYYVLTYLWREVPQTAENKLTDGDTYNIKVPEREVLRLYKEANSSLYTFYSENNMAYNGYYMYNTYPNIANPKTSRYADFMPVEGLGYEAGGVETDTGSYYESVGHVTEMANNNFHYVVHAYGSFVYYEDQNLYFQFLGDDDVYFYVNNELAMDIGGAHSAAGDTLYLNNFTLSDGSKLVDGQVYSFDMFYAERHTHAANMKLNTNIKIVDTDTLTTKGQYVEISGDNNMVDPVTGMGGELLDNGLVKVGDTVAYSFDVVNSHNVAVYDLIFEDKTLGTYLSPNIIALGNEELTFTPTHITDIEVYYRTSTKDSNDNITVDSSTPVIKTLAEIKQMINTANTATETTPGASLPTGSYRVTMTCDQDLKDLLALGIPANCQISIYGFKRLMVEADENKTITNELAMNCSYLPWSSANTEENVKALSGSASRILKVAPLSGIPIATRQEYVLDYGKTVRFRYDEIVTGAAGVTLNGVVGFTANGYNGEFLKSEPADLSTSWETACGTFSYDRDNSLFYRLNKMLTQVEKVYAVISLTGCEITDKDGKARNYPYMLVELILAPATTVYYETEQFDNLFTATHKNGTDWTTANSYTTDIHDSYAVNDPGPINEGADFYFDFKNTAEDQARYSDPRYGGRNYDDRYWVSHYVDGRSEGYSDDYIIDNEEGTLTLRVGWGCSGKEGSGNDMYGPEIYTTRVDGTIHCNNTALNYTVPNDGQQRYFQVRFKTIDCVYDMGLGASDRHNPCAILRCGFYETLGVYDENLEYYSHIWYTLSNDEYITLTAPLNSKYSGLIGFIGVRFRSIRPIEGKEDTACVVVDYIYVGTEEGLPSNNEVQKSEKPEMPDVSGSDVLFFGFDNSEQARERYSSNPSYGGVNFDTTQNGNHWTTRCVLEADGSGTYTSKYTINNTAGVLRFEVGDGYTGTEAGNTLRYGPEIYTTAEANTNDNQNPVLQYVPTDAEYMYIRFKTTNCKYSGGSYNEPDPYLILRFTYLTGSATTYAEAYGYCFFGLNNGGYTTLKVALPDSFRNSTKIGRIGLRFRNLVQATEAGGFIDIDYIYFGPENDLLLVQDETYGYDVSYTDDESLSNSRSLYVVGAGVPSVVENSEGNKYIDYAISDVYTEASFTFTGTGFDIISRTGADQGALRIVVCDQNGYAVKTVSVLNKGIKELYQIPVASVEMRDEVTDELMHGTYTVHIFVNSPFDFGDDGNEDMFGGALDRGGQFYFDAVRIYNPINTAASTDNAKTAYEIYQKHSEADPTIVEIRQKLIDASKDTSSEEMDGVVYLDTKDEGTSQIAAYEEVGPNNEVYLAPGNAIGFKLEASGSVPASIDIGAKSADGSPVTMRASIAGVQTDTAISTNTAQYYPLHIAANQWQSENGKNYVTVRITNSGTSGILSITDIKYAYGVPAANTGGKSRSLRFLVDRDVLPPVEEDDVDGGISIGETLTLESDLTMNFRIKTEQLADYDLSTAYLVVERDVYNSDGTMEVETRTLTEYTVKDNRLVFAYTGISAAQMNDEIRAVLYIKDASGKEYVSNEKVTSVAIYSDLMLGASAGNEKLITLIMDMLNYGTAAQIYFNRHADAPVNEAFESFKTYASYASTDLKAALEDLSGTISNGNSSATITQGLDLSTRVGITYKVKLPSGVNAADATLVVKDADGNELESFDLSSGTVDSKGRCVVTFFGSTSRDMRRVVYATVMVDGEAISDTYSYTISSYAHTIANTAGMPEALVNLTRLMVIYGDSADAYFA